MVEKMKNEIRDRKNIFWFLTAGVVVSLGLYVYFVSHTVYNVVARQRAEKSITALQSGIETLDANYFALKSQVTSALAEAKGFTDISSVTAYVSRVGTGKSLSLNNEI